MKKILKDNTCWEKTEDGIFRIRFGREDDIDECLKLEERVGHGSVATADVLKEHSDDKALIVCEHETQEENIKWKPIVGMGFYSEEHLSFFATYPNFTRKGINKAIVILQMLLSGDLENEDYYNMWELDVVSDQRKWVLKSLEKLGEMIGFDVTTSSKDSGVSLSQTLDSDKFVENALKVLEKELGWEKKRLR